MVYCATFEEHNLGKFRWTTKQGWESNPNPRKWTNQAKIPKGVFHLGGNPK